MSTVDCRGPPWGDFVERHVGRYQRSRGGSHATWICLSNYSASQVRSIYLFCGLFARARRARGGCGGGSIDRSEARQVWAPRARLSSHRLTSHHRPDSCVMGHASCVMRRAAWPDFWRDPRAGPGRVSRHDCHVIRVTRAHAGRGTRESRQTASALGGNGGSPPAPRVKRLFRKT